MMTTILEADLVLQEDPQFPETETGRPRRLAFLGTAPCPVRSEMRRRLHREFRNREAAGADPTAWYVPSGCREPTVYDDLWRTTDETMLPDVIAEVGFGGFNRPEFVDRWIGSGVYGPVDDSEVRPEFRDAGLADTRGIHRIYGVLPEVLLVDQRRLNGRPVPRRWEDVLHSRFRGDVIVGGEIGALRESLLFGLYHQFGESGLVALGENVREFMHPAKMAKTAGSDSPHGAAIYVAPTFFARGRPHREATSLIWPEEGAYCMPFYLLRKTAARPESALPFDFLTGPEWASHLARVGLVPARAGSPALPGRLRWVGWDFVRTQDPEALRPRLNAAFTRGFDARDQNGS